MSKSEHRWLVSISAGRWQASGIRAAMKAGMQVLAIDGDASAPGLRLATRSAVADIKDPKAVLAIVESLKIRPSGVVSFVSEVGMPAAAAMRECYGLAGPDRMMTHALTNKVRQREIWEKVGVPGPAWCSFSSIAEAVHHADELGLPCIVKPCDSAGSRGVTKVETRDSLKEAARKALDASRSGVGLVEAYMVGTEYTVETFGDGRTIHVLAVTEKAKVPGTNGTVAQELATPAVTMKAEIVARAAVDALRALGYLSGPGHTEVILDDNNEPGLVEAAGRGGGFMVFERLVEKASGYDIVTATALQAVGDAPPTVRPKNRAVVLRFFPSRPGLISKLNGFEDACRIPGVEAGPFVTVGQRVGTVRGDGDRLGYVLAEGPTPAEARAAADRAELLINIEVT